MVSVIDKDFDMEGEKSRVSNDVNVNEEIRVSSGFDLGASKSDFDEVRVLKEEEGEGKVLGGYHANGDVGEVKEGRVLSKNGVDGEIVVVGKKIESRNLESGENEAGESEIPGISGVEKLRGVETSEIGMGKSMASGSGRKGMSSLSNKGGEDEGETEARQKGAHKVEVLNMDGRDGEFKMERRRDLGVVGKKLFGIDINGSVMKSVSAKVLGTEFEMGDMVWGKVKSHPWWPGHLFNEAFASTSVRRTRSDGHILVAFFGDSSYGWFDPDELVPYDPHYAEKSQQTTSRNFVRAVEESVDEASRRSALGLSCYCRNPYNFRPTDVPGYLAVDIIDFEPGTVYSVSQIQKARDSFSPTETLSFIQQLATAPMSSDRSKSLDFIKLKSTALAYRRSIFEEFDETYAEAFGHKPVRSKLPAGSTVKEPSRAPLSGPLVFADNLGGRKSSTKAMKSKEQSKKDRYLFKRRDEFGTLRSAKIQGPASPDSSCEDVTPDLATSSYVFQKRDQPVSSNDLGESPAVDQLETLGYTVTPEDTDTTGHILTSSLQHSQSEASDVCIVPNKTIGIIPSSSDAGNLDASSGLLKKKKKKGTKRPVSELSSEKSEPKEKMKKKSRKTEKFKNTEHPERDSDVLTGVSRVSPVGRPTQIVSSPRDDTQVDRSKKYVPQEVGLVPLTGNWENEADIQQILADLHGLALDPLHGIERNGPAIAQHFILKFRSLVFLKGSSGLAMAEPEHGEAQLSESPGNEVAYRPPTESSKTVSSLKPPKVSARQDDSTKVGRKRVPSERQEENAAKRVKKISDVKNLGAEKRALLKNPELQHPDGKSRVSTAKSPQSRPSKPERPTRVEEPTYLIMKYQPGSSLPSLVELKARFARFGPLDITLSRVFYKTFTCRVAFLFKQDANIAYRYAVGNKSMFSNVRFMLKPVAGPDMPSEPVVNPNPSSTEPRLATLPVQPQSARQLKSILKKPLAGDESSGPSNGAGGMRTPRVRFNIGDEKGSGSNKGGVLQVQMMESRNPVLSSNEGAVSSSSSSFSSTISMDVNKNQRLLSQRPLEAPLLPLPHFVGPPPVINNRHLQVEMGPITNVHENFTTATATTSLSGVSQVLPQPPPPPPPPAPSTDISQQMMSLLTRCHDVVTNLKSTLGYIPYYHHSQ
ncbi:PWWP domain-containing protein 1-like [Silene latifolia]|uniref:PWWP domain-containing protein 1-like n=1 Tax=Silene latifolia TaxID=37657 RepID=UPI003D78A31F